MIKPWILFSLSSNSWRIQSSEFSADYPDLHAPNTFDFILKLLRFVPQLMCLTFDIKNVRNTMDMEHLDQILFSNPTLERLTVKHYTIKWSNI